MKIRVAALIVLVAGIGIATPAHAADEWTYRFAAPVVCVQADFPLHSSGHQVGRAVEQWNAAQTSVRLTLRYEPGCAVLHVHEFGETIDGQPTSDDGLTTYPQWHEGSMSASGVWLLPAVDIWLRRLPIRLTLGCWRRAVVAHEIGHALGLYAHRAGARSVMNPVLNPRSCGVPSAVDARRVTFLYARP